MVNLTPSVTPPLGLARFVAASPGVRLIRFYRQNEGKILLAGLVVGGLTFVGLLWAMSRAAPVAVKIAAASKHGVAAKALLAKYGIAAL